MKDFEKTLNKVKKFADEEHGNVSVAGEDENVVTLNFQRHLSIGQDFNFEISSYKNEGIYGILNAIYDYWENFDCLYEAYWLDDSGHGTDVYNDMKKCEKSIYQLWENICYDLYRIERRNF